MIEHVGGGAPARVPALAPALTPVLTTVLSTEPRRWSAAFAADFHLTPTHPEGIRRAVEWLRLCQARTSRLFLLGDVFDLWTSGAELSMPELAPLFDALRSAHATGVQIDFIAGNRDFNFTVADGAAVGIDVHVEEELRLEVDGLSLHLLHGDQLLRDDVGYQRLKWVLRSAPLRFLARHVPAALSLAFGRRVRRYSASAAPAKPRHQLRIVPEAVVERLSGERERMICGHVHRLERIGFGGGRELLVLPPFYESGRFAVAVGGALRIAALDGSESDLPAPRAPGDAAP